MKRETKLLRWTKRLGMLVGCFMLQLHPLLAQEEESLSNIDFKGYLSTIGQSLQLKDATNRHHYYQDYTLHQRSQLTWYASETLTAHLAVDNQYRWSDSFSLYPNYANSLGNDKGWVNLKFMWGNAGKRLGLTQIDRLYLTYNWKSIAINVGRQRINWGRTLVWNPNDLFNTFSFYDMDYPERSGVDALRITYYKNATTSSEIVAKMDAHQHLSAAVKHKWNCWNYDFQLLAGYMNDRDFTLGAGWEGALLQAGFRGELTYYHPRKKSIDSSDAFLASIALDYTFNNKWSAQLEALYNDANHLLDLNNGQASLTSQPASSKSLAFSTFNIYANTTYILSPILTLNLSTIYYTDYHGLFVMPRLECSLTNNLTGSLLLQYFNLQMKATPTNSQPSRQATTQLFARLKWSF